MSEEKTIINLILGMRDGTKTSANPDGLLNSHKMPQENSNKRLVVVDNFDCKVCDTQEECYGMKLDVIFSRYPSAEDVLEEKNIVGLKLFVEELEAICLKRGEGIQEINLMRDLTRA